MPGSLSDAGYGWVIVAGSFFANLIIDGCVFSFGVVFVELLDAFDESREKTAWIGSLFMAMPLLGGPIASWLMNVIGCRGTMMVGGLVASVGYLSSSWVSSVEVLYVTFGLVAGSGLALIYVSNIIIVALYFKQRLALAAGLSFSGSGIGALVIAPLTELLIDKYGWRGALIILSAVMLNTVACGALMRPPSPEPQAPRQAATSSTLGKSTEFSTADVGGKSEQSGGVGERDTAGRWRIVASHSMSHLPTSRVVTKIFDESAESVTKMPSVREDSGLIHVYGSGFCKRMDITGNGVVIFVADRRVATSTGNLLENASPKKSMAVPRHVHLVPPPTLNGRGAVNSVSCPRLYYPSDVDANKRPSLTDANGNDVNGTTTITCDKMDDVTTITSDHVGCFANCQSKITSNTRKADCSSTLVVAAEPDADPPASSSSAVCDEVVLWLRNPALFCFFVHNVLLFLTSDIPYVFLPDESITGRHFTTDEASFLIAIMGASSAIGQFLIGYVCDSPVVDAMLLCGAATSVAGVSTFVMPWLPDFVSLAVYSAVCGLTGSVQYALTSKLLIYLNFETYRLPVVVGYLSLIRGIANLFGLPLAGLTYDVTSSYDVTFYWAGTAMLLSGLLLFAIPPLMKCHAKLDRVVVVLEESL